MEKVIQSLKEVRLWTKNGHTKDDLRLPTDDNLLAQACRMKLLRKIDRPEYKIAISTEDVYKSAEVVNLITKELGGKITRQPGPILGINTKITSFLDHDRWKIDSPKGGKNGAVEMTEEEALAEQQRMFVEARTRMNNGVSNAPKHWESDPSLES